MHGYIVNAGKTMVFCVDSPDAIANLGNSLYL